MSNGFNTDGMFTVPESESPLMNCLESIECTVAFDVRDWSEDRRSAWIYGIVFGCGDDIDDVKRKFNWDDKDIERLNMYNEQWNELKNELKEKDLFPAIVGASIEMLVDGEWKHGKVVEGYRFNDGIVTMQTEDGQRYWCGQDRTDCYRKYEE